MTEIKTHPFKPFIVPSTEILIVGSLPPEGASMYFSNSHQIRLWDILYAIWNNEKKIGSGGWNFPLKVKFEILYDLKLGLTDIILNYQRTMPDSNLDEYINPVSYFNLTELSSTLRIKKILFVYESAARWFLHSLTGVTPLPFKRITCFNLNRGKITHPLIQHFKPECYLLPNPLSRGAFKGETLDLKRNVYQGFITNN